MDKEKFGLDAIYVIVLQRDKKRLEYANKTIAQHNLDAIIFPAIDGQAVTREQLSRYLQDNTLCLEVEDLLTWGELGCVLSHIAVWKEMLKKGRPEVLILEEDFILAENFANRLHRFRRQLPNDYDVAYLWLWNRDEYGVIPLPGLPEVCIPKFPRGTVGYLLSARGAAKILAVIQPLCDTIDDELNRLLRENELKAYATADNLILHFEDLDSNICGTDFYKNIEEHV